MQRHHRWTFKRWAIHGHWEGEMDQVYPQASSQCGQLPVVPPIPAERACLHLSDVNSEPRIRIKVRVLYHRALPWRYHKMYFGNFPQLQEASHDIKGVALQPGDLRGERSGRDKNLHNFDTS